jgi:hypothetical protein
MGERADTISRLEKLEEHHKLHTLKHEEIRNEFQWKHDQLQKHFREKEKQRYLFKMNSTVQTDQHF